MLPLLLSLTVKTSDRSPANPNSIHYRSPYEESEDSEEEEDGEGADSSNRRMMMPGDDEVTHSSGHVTDQASIVDGPPSSIHSSMLPHRSTEAASSSIAPSGSSVKTSVKTAASVVARDAPVGTHSPSEVAAITRAITESFLAVDEGWINSIDPVATHQTSCQSNGRWNSGACALTVFTVQRLEWTSVSEEHRERELRGPAKSRGHDTSQNKDAARRRMLDYASKAKSASSMSTISSTSSLTTTDDRVNASGLESEITETEGEDDDYSSQDGGEKQRRRNPFRRPDRTAGIPKESLISPPGGCSCHCYRAYDALLYTAHVGDCRAVMLGSAPPRTIKVHGSTAAGHGNQTDDESSHHSSDETECLSSSDHDADSSDDEEIESERDPENATAVTKSTSTSTASSYMAYMRRPARRQSRRRRYDDVGMNAPFIALPPLEGFRSVEIEMDDMEYDRRRRNHHQNNGNSQSDSSSSSSQDSREFPPAIILPPVTRPIDLTTDHSAYNPAEVTAVLRRCNNAPRAISAGVGGGIKRVAGSLAVTRALGDAYLKTPLLSFFPYKRHAPYITARPEVNCRPIVKEGDKVLILATDGVWERASGEDVLRWVRTFYAERIAEAERRNSLDRLNKMDCHALEDGSSAIGKKDDDSMDSKQAYGQEQEQGQSASSRNDANCAASSNTSSGEGNSNRKRDVPSSPSPPPTASKRRKITGRTTTRRAAPFGSRRNSTVADVIVRRVLNKVRRARNISSLHALMSLPPGRARRSKHDDITACVVDLSAYVS
jgi:serine/threonine protein phosphatase PrpC